LILDVGCGSGVSYGFKPHFKADVFLDVEKPSSPIPNFVVGDVQHLPFKTGSFKEVYCNHVLEHVENPFQALKELIRVANGTVTVKVPHRFSVNAKKDPAHISFFNVKWFDEALKRLHVSFHRINVEYRSFPHPYMPLFRLPHEITVQIRKHKNERTMSKSEPEE